MAIKYTVTVHELFKYTMNLVYTRVKEEWKDLDVAYPQWLTTLVMDEVYYITTMTLVCVNSFAVGLAIGISWTMV
jgi:hypothetical protein